MEGGEQQTLTVAPVARRRWATSSSRSSRRHGRTITQRSSPCSGSAPPPPGQPRCWLQQEDRKNSTVAAATVQRLKVPCAPHQTFRYEFAGFVEDDLAVSLAIADDMGRSADALSHSDLNT